MTCTVAGPDPVLPLAAERPSQSPPEAVDGSNWNVSSPAPRLLTVRFCAAGLDPPCCATNTMAPGDVSAAGGVAAGTTCSVTETSCGSLVPPADNTGNKA